MAHVSFQLYVAGASNQSRQAEANLRRLVDERLGGDSDLAVIDVTKDPERAERERILTTPTLIKTSPSPSRRVTGDLSDFEKVLSALALPLR